MGPCGSPRSVPSFSPFDSLRHGIVTSERRKRGGRGIIFAYHYAAEFSNPFERIFYFYSDFGKLMIKFPAWNEMTMEPDLKIGKR